MKIDTKILGEIPSGISLNYEELSRDIEGMIEECSVSGDGISTEIYNSAKENRATLNKILGSISDEYTSVKKRLLAPLDAKTENGMSYTEIISDMKTKLNDAIGVLAKTITSYESARKAEKEARIREIVEDVMASQHLVRESPMTDSFISGCKSRKTGSWLNASCSEATIRRELEEYVSKCNDGVAKVLETYGPSVMKEDLDEIVAKFCKTFDPFVAQTEYNAIMERKNRAAAQDKDMERSIITEPIKDGGAKPTIYSCTMRFVGTENAFLNLKEYLQINNDITYKVIEKMSEVK